MSLKALALAAASAIVIAGPAAAQQYVSGSAGFNFQADSDNAGSFSRDFVTGDGVAVPAGTVLAAGTDVGWTTEFETGLFLAGAYGIRLNDAFRVEAEISYTSSEVDTHTGVTVGGGDIGAADAAVLITGSAPLGVTVADVVAAGQGDISTVGYAVNGYYDFTSDALPVDLYVGLGVGLAEVSVVYVPSDISIIDDSEMVGFFQVMVGGSYPLADNTALFGGYRFRQTGDAEVDSALIPATLEIENTNNILEFGVRHSF